MTRFNTLTLALCCLITLTVNARLPGWILSPQSSENEFFGIGEGKTREQARDVALKNILGQVNTRVSSSYQQKQTFNNNNFSESINQIVNSSVEELPISGYKELKSYINTGTTYLLISVSKKQLLDTFMLDIDKNIKKSQVIIQNRAQAGTELEWWYISRNDLYQLLLITQRLESFIPQLNNNISAETAMTFALNAQLKTFTKQYCLYVMPHKNKSIRSALRDKVIRAGLIADNKSCSYKIELIETTSERLLFGSTHTFSLAGTLSFLKNGNTMATESINEVGSSPNGMGIAKKAAYYRLLNKIKNDDGDILRTLLTN
jgi:hypothetical protein